MLGQYKRKNDYLRRESKWSFFLLLITRIFLVTIISDGKESYNYL